MDTLEATPEVLGEGSRVLTDKDWCEPELVHALLLRLAGDMHGLHLLRRANLVAALFQVRAPCRADGRARFNHGTRCGVVGVLLPLTPWPWNTWCRAMA